MKQNEKNAVLVGLIAVKMRTRQEFHQKVDDMIGS